MRTIQIQIPDELEKLINNFAKDQQKFILDAIKDRITRIREKKLEKLLIEGYKSAANEAKRINQEFELIEIENWDEY